MAKILPAKMSTAKILWLEYLEPGSVLVAQRDEIHIYEKEEVKEQSKT